MDTSEIIKLIHDRIKDFHLGTDAKSRVIKMENIKYSMAEKNYSGSKRRAIRILLFDYNEAPIMFNQATQIFNTSIPIETDTLTFRHVVMSGYTGWESYDVKRKKSQILLGIHNRFFLTIEGTNVDLEILQYVLHEFKFGDFHY